MFINLERLECLRIMNMVLKRIWSLNEYGPYSEHGPYNEYGSYDEYGHWLKWIKLFCQIITLSFNVLFISKLESANLQ